MKKLLAIFIVVTVAGSAFAAENSMEPVNKKHASGVDSATKSAPIKKHNSSGAM